MAGVVYGHCSKCGMYQGLLGDPVVVSDGDSFEVICVGVCWLCNEMFEWVILQVKL